MAKARPAKKTCFVISPIGDANTSIRQRADTLLKYIIKRVLEEPEFDFDVRRADEIQKPGLITQQVIERVVNADLVIADLTGHNANVFYELAIRHAARKPAIHMTTAGEQIPFDIANQRTIYYDVDIPSAEKAQAQLQEQVRAVIAGTDTDNPISAALQLLQFEKSADPIEHGIARVLQEVGAIKELLTPVINTAQTQKEKLGRYTSWGIQPIANFGFTPWPGAVVGSGPGLLGSDVETPAGWVVSMGAPGTPPVCADCGQPIAGPVSAMRSSDSKPIHPPGQCPAPPTTPRAASG